MSWTPPPLPLTSHDSIVAYWRAVLEIPLSEPGAEILRDMASQRLVELQAEPAHRVEHFAATDQRRIAAIQ